jgi:hypothetical protein
MSKAETIVVTGLFLLGALALAAGVYQLTWTIQTIAGYLS